MATVYTLPIDDGIVAPALELMRRSIQPGSVSLPHITVRYSKYTELLLSRDLYSEFVADEVDIVEPSSFDWQGSQLSTVRTLFFRCSSEQLEYLQYKPDFPQSSFHVSIYDGPPSAIAAQALGILREYPWDLRAPLPHTRLKRGFHKRSQDALLTEQAQALLSRLGFDHLSFVLESSRSRLLRTLSEYLHEKLERNPSRPATSARLESVRPHHPEQGAFWSRTELMDSVARDHVLTRDRERLRHRGAFMTPPEIAYDIVKGASRIIGTRDVNYGDPSSGVGIFLAALLRQIGSGQIKTATLVDSDHASVSTAADRWRHLNLVAEVDDFVSGSLGEKIGRSDSDHPHWYDVHPDVVITNPPYVRSQSLNDEDVTRWRSAIKSQLGMTVSVRSDLYVYFVLASHGWLARDGVGVWLLPNEFMFTNYGRVLRDYFTRHVTLLKVHTYDGPSVFANARVSSCAVFYCKRDVQAASLVEFSAGGSIEKPYRTRSVPLKMLERAAKWHTIADEGAGWASSSELSADQLTVGDLFSVRRGVATGANSLFVVKDEVADLFGGSAARWLKPVLPRSRDLPGPVVDADADGLPLIPELRWLIDSDASLGEIAKHSPTLANYLRSIAEVANSRTLVARRKPFYRQEMNEPAPYFFSYMSRTVSASHRFYLNRSRAIALNNYLVLRPKPELASWLSSAAGNDLVLLTALRQLNVDAMERVGRTYVEGLTKIEPRELAQLPLSPPGGRIAWEFARSRRLLD